MQVKRADRVEGLIQKEISELLLSKIKDPRLVRATITKVKITDDLRSARVYFSVFEGQERSESALAGFESATGYMKRELSRRLKLRYAPKLKFVYDETFDRVDELDRIFKNIHDEKSSTTENPS